MELQSGNAAAVAGRLSPDRGGLLACTKVLLTGHRGFVLPGQCGLSIGRKKTWKHRCDGVAGISSALAMDWRPAFDEVLLMSSVLLAYVAGVVRPFAGLGVSGKNAFATQTKSLVMEEDHVNKFRAANDESVWDSMNRKLVAAISRVEDGGDSFGQLATSPSLCLQALANGPRLRLFLAALSLLRNETSSRDMSLDELCGMVGPVYRLWISQESRKTDRDLPGYFPVKVIETEDFGDIEAEAKEYMSTRLQRHGKATLYIDVLCSMCKKPSSVPDVSIECVTNVLEDVVIAISDGVAALYLSAVAVGSAGWSKLLHPSICSTRSLERFRNEVALQQWVHYNFGSVAAIYEDRVELWGLVADKGRNEPDPNTQKKQKGKPLSEKGDLFLDRLSIRMRRRNDLKALTGWRYCYSLYLEFSDVVGPLLQILVTKVGQGLSFLLVCLIGRSFGLIYQGIRQSIKWSSD